MKRILPMLPALLYMAVIFWMSSRPAPESLKVWPILWQVKLVHIVEYGVLALLWAFGLTRAGLSSWHRAAVAAVLITFLWGISDEIHQNFVPGRTAKLADALTDLLAAVLAIGLCYAWRRLIHRSTHRSMV